ncbi:MAG TPA: hypothetical protein VK039_02875, partial [Brevibacterium sp.]|nr:hypothetical protein [Brevibacterium sp.]
DGPASTESPAFEDGPVLVHSPAASSGPVDGAADDETEDASAQEGAPTLGAAIADLFPSRDDEDAYLAVQVFLSAEHDTAAGALREALARKSGGTVAFGWGPRYLHSTGQLHKGGRPDGAFLFVTAAPDTGPSLEVPEAGFDFGRLQKAQADGDAQVLTDLGRRVLRLTLTDRSAGVAHLLAAIEALPDAPPRLPDEEPAPADEATAEADGEPVPETGSPR